MFKRKLPQQEQGFTLVEVLVSILIATLFTAVAMQGMVIATVFKAVAKQHAEATTWIQEDLENVRYTASQLQYTPLRTSAPLGATVLEVTSTVGFEAGDSVIVGAGSTARTIASGGVNAAARTLTLSSGLPEARSTGDVVVATTKCNATTQGSGFADHLRSNLPPLINGGTKTIAGKTYTLTRYGPDANSTTPNIDNFAFEVMQLKYKVTPQSDVNAIATMYTEVIPNAAFKCP